MSRIVFCATEEGVQRQTRTLTERNGEPPRHLRSDRDVLDALLSLEVGRDVVALASTVVTGWRLPEGVEVGFDSDMDAEGVRELRARCESRGLRARAGEGFEVLMSPAEIGARVAELLSREVRDPFGPYTAAELGPEAA